MQIGALGAEKGHFKKDSKSASFFSWIETATIGKMKSDGGCTEEGRAFYYFSPNDKILPQT